MSLKLKTILFIFLCLVYSGCKNRPPYHSNTFNGKTDTVINGQRIIFFSGYEWTVGSSTDKKCGPGPNYFSDSKENVWLDKKGRLHLRITHRNDKWYCAKISMRKSYGYGKYVFQVDSRVDRFDKNVVGGLYTYYNDREEIDIELSKWSIDGNMDSQFVIQPGSKKENKKRYFLNLTDKKSTHWFNWQHNHIEFMSYRGHSPAWPPANKIIQHWIYTGTNIPPDSEEQARINLWLFRGAPPADLRETEMIISGFHYIIEPRTKSQESRL